MILPIFINNCTPIIIIKNFVVRFYCLLPSFTYLSISTNEKKTLNEATNWLGSFLSAVDFSEVEFIFVSLAKLGPDFLKPKQEFNQQNKKIGIEKLVSFESSNWLVAAKILLCFLRSTLG